ncbi:MAG TPA: 4'-phosphopantetheinyl transferase superfamily protein [Solirubrobacteraceae bacterium]|nr:4'-phosphopantetheinyl transferase superfamily protein [Solirubrobacteraceae bacterium]
MIELLLPAGVASVETRGAHDPGELLGPEREALGRASAGRAREFAAGRACGRRALVDLGFEPAPILRGSDREPCWPPGVVGSITHTRGYCAAAAAPIGTIATLGIDAELHDRLTEGVRAQIALDCEASFLAAREGDGVCWDRLLFSAKESVFKAWFPLTRRWLGFKQARIDFDPPAGTFAATLLVPGPVSGGRAITAFRGRFLVADGFVLTAIALAARAPEPLPVTPS